MSTENKVTQYCGSAQEMGDTVLTNRLERKSAKRHLIKS
jgi:hypothetical protein